MADKPNREITFMSTVSNPRPWCDAGDVYNWLLDKNEEAAKAFKEDKWKPAERGLLKDREKKMGAL